MSQSESEVTQDMAAKTKTMELTKQDRATLEKLLPSDIAVAVYIAKNTQGLQLLIKQLLKSMKDPKCGARTKHDIAKLLLDRVLGPVAKGGLNVQTETDGTVHITWLDSD